MTMPAGQYKDRLFSFLFGNEEHRDWTLSLYNAVNGSHYTDPGAITITTLRQVLYLGMHNDVSFLIAGEMNMYEQQSTYNPNMPLRMLQYAGNLFEQYITFFKLNKYGKRLIELPVPRLLVFYNGLDDGPDESLHFLSDAFPQEMRDQSDIQVRVRMVNINSGHSPALMLQCKPLHEYTWVVDHIRALEPVCGLDTAIDRTIDAMPDSFVTKSCLEVHRAEVKAMLLTEYNEAHQMELFRQEGIQIGEKRGIQIGEKRGIQIGEQRGIQIGEQRGIQIGEQRGIQIGEQRDIQIGEQRGEIKGQNRFGALVMKLLSLGRNDDIEKAACDPEYRARLFDEFQIALN